MRPRFLGTIEGGKLTLYNRDAFKRYLHTLDGKVEVEVKPYKNDRSNRQNRYYWGVVIDILSKWNGDTPEDWHEILKQLFLKTGKVSMGIQLVRSTARLKVGEFEEYLERIRTWASMEHRVYIPDPNEQ